MYSVVLTLNNKLDQSPRYALEIGLVNEHVGEKINVPHGWRPRHYRIAIWTSYPNKSVWNVKVECRGDPDSINVLVPLPPNTDKQYRCVRVHDEGGFIQSNFFLVCVYLCQSSTAARGTKHASNVYRRTKQPSYCVKRDQKAMFSPPCCCSAVDTLSCRWSTAWWQSTGQLFRQLESSCSYIQRSVGKPGVWANPQDHQSFFFWWKYCTNKNFKRCSGIVQGSGQAISPLRQHSMHIFWNSLLQPRRDGQFAQIVRWHDRE